MAPHLFFWRELSNALPPAFLHGYLTSSIRFSWWNEPVVSS